MFQLIWFLRWWWYNSFYFPLITWPLSVDLPLLSFTLYSQCRATSFLFYHFVRNLNCLAFISCRAINEPCVCDIIIFIIFFVLLSYSIVSTSPPHTSPTHSTHSTHHFTPIVLHSIVHGTDLAHSSPRLTLHTQVSHIETYILIIGTDVIKTMCAKSCPLLSQVKMNVIFSDILNVPPFSFWKDIFYIAE